MGRKAELIDRDDNPALRIVKKRRNRIAALEDKDRPLGAHRAVELLVGNRILVDREKRVEQPVFSGYHELPRLCLFRH